MAFFESEAKYAISWGRHRQQRNGITLARFDYAEVGPIRSDLVMFSPEK